MNNFEDVLKSLETKSLKVCVIGIGRIGGSALEAMARQPELTGKIQTVMLIAAALIEGIGFAALFAL